MKATLVILLALASRVVCAQPATQLTCDGLPRDSFCLIQEAPVPFAASLSADTGGNGAIHVATWDGAGVWARWEIRASAESLGDAWSLGLQVHVGISDGEIRANGPEHLRHASWSVTYEIFVPQQANLSLSTINGGIDIAGVQGTLRFSTVNGGIQLNNVAGDSAGSTVNGPIRLDSVNGNVTVSTVNGGIAVTVAPSYNGQIVISNTNGAVDTNLPVTIQKAGRLGHNVILDGGGDGSIHLKTVNGGISLKAATTAP